MVEHDEQEIKENEIHPEVEKILDYMIPKRKVLDDLLTSEDGVRVGDLIDVRTDIRFDNQTGKPMMMHSGILAIWDGIGAEILEPKLEKTAPGEYQVVQGVRFADGTVFYSTGEASQRNTDDRELSGKFPVNQAHIRAINKAMIRGLGLYRVLLTEEESDDFKINQMALLQQKNEEAFRQQQQYVQALKKSKDKEQRLFLLIDGLIELASLPETDEKYPNRYITEIKEDVDYLEQLKMGEDKMIGFVANQFLKKHAADIKVQNKIEETSQSAVSEEPPTSEEEQAYPESTDTQNLLVEENAETKGADAKVDEELVSEEKQSITDLKVPAHDEGWLKEGEEELVSTQAAHQPSVEAEDTEEDEDSEIKYLETFFGDITAQIEMEALHESEASNSTSSKHEGAEEDENTSENDQEPTE